MNNNNYPLLTEEATRKNFDIEEYQIKCTYAELFDKYGNKVFSIQNDDFTKHTNLPILGASGLYEYIADEYDSDLVPIELSLNAKLYIKNKFVVLPQKIKEMIDGGIAYVKLVSITPVSGEEEIEYIEEPKTKDYSKLKWIAIALAASLFL